MCLFVENKKKTPHFTKRQHVLLYNKHHSDERDLLSKQILDVCEVWCLDHVDYPFIFF